MSNPCHKNATCFETSGSFMCKCRSGFIGDGILCAGNYQLLQENTHYEGKSYGNKER